MTRLQLHGNKVSFFGPVFGFPSCRSSPYIFTNLFIFLFSNGIFHMISNNVWQYMLGLIIDVITLDCRT
ncbi:hypothetical protein VNO77_21856 [Canavalia gladiata]|uniref:Uncharacterized protein n=1 Tax=Canavalia gladiata TaxID=3824 RepID=A0AAN9L1H4_CANGL